MADISDREFIKQQEESRRTLERLRAMEEQNKKVKKKPKKEGVKNGSK